MSKIDPRLLAVGLGGAAGVNVLATDNDPLAIAAGLAIGGGTGALMNLSTPDDLDMRAHRSINNTLKGIDPTATTGRAQTFDELKQTVKQMATNIAKNSSSDAEEFSRTSPYSTLNKNTFQDFSRYIDNMTSEESLRELKLALQLKDDTKFVSTSGLSVKEDINSEIKVKEGASIQAKSKALESELKRLGYSGEALDEKLLKFEPLLKNHNGSIRIADGQLDLVGTGKIQLTYEIGDGKEKALVYANNRNMYDVKRVNLFGSALVNNPEITSKAVADALGIQAAELFDLNAQLSKVAGMAPDDAVAMMANSLTPDQMSKFIAQMNSNYNYSEDMSGQLKKHLFGNGPAVTNPSSYSLANSETVDYKTALQFDENGLSSRPFRNIGVTSSDGRQMSEVKALSRMLSEKTGQAFYGVSADHITQLPMTDALTNKPVSAHAPLERNPHTVNNRATVAMSDTALNKTVRSIVESLGGKHNFASAVAMQSFSVDPDAKLIDEANGNKSVRIMDLIANIFGSDKATGDGYGLANKSITNKITTEGTMSTLMRPTSGNKYIIETESMRKYLEGELDLAEMKKQALIGSTRLSGRVETALEKAKVRLEGLNSATSAEGVFNLLKEEHRTFGKYKDYNDFLKANKKIAKSKDQLAAMQELAKKTVLSKVLSGDSLYTQGFKDNNHFEVLKATSRVDKDLAKLQKAVSSNNFGNAVGVINSLLAHNEVAKTHTDAFKTYFPRAGSVIGYNNDMTPVTLKESYKFLEFEGAMKVIDGAEDNTREAIQYMYKGMNRAGFEDISKTYGASSKEQLKHLESEEFGKIGFIHSLVKEDRIKLNRGAFEITLANSAKPITLKQSQLGGNILEELKNAGATKEDLKVARKSLNFFTKNVATISEDGGSGMKTAEDLFKSLEQFTKGQADESVVSSKFLGDNLLARTVLDRAKQGDLTTNQLKGLSNFAVSLSRDRASINYLVTTMSSLEISSNLKVSRYTNAAGGSAKDNALAALRTFAADVLDDKSFLQGDFDMNRFKQGMANQIQTVSNLYTPEAVHEFYQDPAKLNKLANLFMAERTYRVDAIGDSLIQLSSFNKRVEHETGAGKTGKSMSWNVQTQLKMNGLTDADLSAFGKFNANNIADYQSVLALRMDNVATINSQLNDQNLGEFKRALGHSPTKRREALKAAGIEVDGLLGVYKLQSENKLGLKNMPIMLENSGLFGTYTDEHGNLSEKSVNRITSNIIMHDLKLQRTDLTKTQREATQHALDEEVKHLANTLGSVVGGQDNIMKKAMAREAEFSRYSTMVPVSGSLQKLADKQQSVVSVSSEGLVKRFQQLGYDYKNVDEIASAGHLRKDGNLWKVFIDQEKDVPLFGIINREPATGPGSARFVEYYLDKSLTNSETNIHVAANDKLYKYFQFGDFDLDHTLEYMPKFKGEGVDLDFLKQMLAKGTKVNEELYSMVDYAKTLGVKGSTKGKMSTLFDVYERYEGKFANTQEWMNKYIEDEIIAKHKGGDRKAISPTVTKLAADINDAIARADTDNTKAYYNARALSHYFVENLLKSQHIDNQKYGKMTTTMAEQLQAYMNSGRTDETLSRFKQEFRNYIDDTVIANLKNNADLTPEQRAKFIQNTDEAVDLIARSLHYDKDSGPITPMHARASHSPAQFSGTVDNLIKSATGNGPSVQILPVTEELMNDASEMSLAQKGKLGYYKALETLKHNIGNNKKLLATAAAATVGAALLTQSKPQFGDSRASANPSGMLMAPSKSMLEDTAQQASDVGGVNRAVEYIRPYKRDNSYVSIDSSPMGSSGNLHQDINHFIFGDGLSSARIVNME